MIRGLAWCPPALAVFLLTAPASASLVAALELPDLVSRADVIVVGTVVDQQARWDDRGRIVTDVILQVDDGIAGAETGATVTVTHLGGVIGDVGMHVSGAPRFRTGERALLFARRGGPGREALRPVGMSQGRMIVVIEEGRELVLPGAEGLSLVRPGAGGQLLAAPAALLHPRPLTDVVAEVRELLARERSQ